MILPDSKASDSGKTNDVSEQSEFSTTQSDTFDPPPYTPSEGPSEPPASSSTFQPRVNHLLVSEKNSAIKGEWVVDTGLKVPQSLLPQIPEGEVRQNLKVQSHNGSVCAEIKLVNGRDSKGRALLEVGAHNGSAYARVNSRDGQRFRLKTSSHNGSVTVKLPLDFEGPISFSTQCGSICFSPRIKQKLVTFSKDRSAGKAFLGDWEAAGFGDGEHENWQGDELDISSKNGSVSVGFSDELTGGEMFVKTFQKEGAFAAMGQVFGRAFGKSKASDNSGWYSEKSGTG